MIIDKQCPKRQLQNWLLRNEFNIDTMKIIKESEEYSTEVRYIEYFMNKRLNVKIRIKS